MLILTRRPKKHKDGTPDPRSQVIIDGSILVTVLEAEGDQATIQVNDSLYRINLDEEIQINGNIIVYLLAAKGNNVKIGVQAPKHIAIDRRERLNSTASSNQED